MCNHSYVSYKFIKWSIRFSSTKRTNFDRFSFKLQLSFLWAKVLLLNFLWLSTNAVAGIFFSNFVEIDSRLSKHNFFILGKRKSFIYSFFFLLKLPSFGSFRRIPSMSRWAQMKLKTQVERKLSVEVSSSAIYKIYNERLRATHQGNYIKFEHSTIFFYLLIFHYSVCISFYTVV